MRQAHQDVLDLGEHPGIWETSWEACRDMSGATANTMNASKARNPA